jgi:AcrR family transcriptional regulator
MAVDSRPPVRQRDAARSQAAILTAARAEFAERGFEGARIDAIAVRAGMNKRMLYHYFGDKEALYTTVLTEAYREIRAGERELSLDRYPPVEAMARLVRFTFRHFLDNPWFVQLLTNENLLQARFLKTLPEMHGLHSPLVQELSNLIARGGKDGVFRADVDPVQLYISIAALGYFYLSNAATLSVIFDADLRAPDRVTAREDHAVEMVLRFLEAR